MFDAASVSLVLLIKKVRFRKFTQFKIRSELLALQILELVLNSDDNVPTKNPFSGICKRIIKEQLDLFESKGFVRFMEISSNGKGYSKTWETGQWFAIIELCH